MPLHWYLYRLSAMSPQEVIWRLGEKIRQHRERKFSRNHISVTEKVIDRRLANLSFDADRLGIAPNTDGHTFNTHIHLLGGFSYDTYKTSWHAGFQTANEWPRTFAYDLRYKQNDEIGDARTNWELNRHFQWALLAKDYFFSGDRRYLDELRALHDDWCRENPFLIGISWTSVMEVAIRAISWMYALAFLKKAGCKDTAWLDSLQNGIVNMLTHVARHRSRFSSANNHLVVEAAAMTIGGYALSYGSWREQGLRILTEELPRQNYSDGVNKEMSLHYQAFVLEAYALTAHCVRANGEDVPGSWLSHMDSMCRFICHSSFDGQSVIAFGDDDEGKVLDLEGGDVDYISYVLQLCSLTTQQRYTSFSKVSETVRCLFDDSLIGEVKKTRLTDTSDGHCFAQGGYTFMRSDDRQVLIAIDHADLGFGSIAAHGHADALSFQITVRGIPFFTDPGTYIYHCDIDSRNMMRHTSSHSTLCIEGCDQSEMLGAFLWGRKAKCKLIDYRQTDDMTTLTAMHDGYKPVCHQRTFQFNRHTRRLTITDTLSQESTFTATLVLGARCHAQRAGNHIIVTHDDTTCTVSIPEECLSADIQQMALSEAYGTKTFTQAIKMRGKGKSMTTIIDLISSKL